MSITVGQAQMQDALKELLMKWDRVKDHWADNKAKEFEKDYLDPLKPKVRTTLEGLARVGEVISAARRDCE